MENHSQTKFLGDDHLHERGDSSGSVTGCLTDSSGIAHGSDGASEGHEAPREPGQNSGTCAAVDLEVRRRQTGSSVFICDRGELP